MDQKSMKEAYKRLYPTEAVRRVRDEMQERYSRIAGNKYSPNKLQPCINEKTGEVRYFGRYRENKKG